ncbi:MAG: serine hydrolase domain-containing protein [Verrucomicrobiota bacterium JB022]|nr:serine hydrolase domain-containing protein [Verrucomicrobiota bacterium JB022]
MEAKPKLDCTSAETYQDPLAPTLEGAIALVDLPAIKGEVSAPQKAALDAVLEQGWGRVQAGHLGLAVITADGRTWAASRSREGEAPGRFWWASVGKAFTAMVVVQLVEEGKLRYDQTLADFAPQVPYAELITVRHLLEHTSGIFSFQEDRKFREQHGYKSPGDLLKVALRHDPAFCPGAHWHYSNTGYILLGQIIEQVEGAPYHEVVNRRIFAPLGLKHAAALAPRAQPDDVALPAEAKGKPAARPHHALRGRGGRGLTARSGIGLAGVSRGQGGAAGSRGGDVCHAAPDVWLPGAELRPRCDGLPLAGGRPQRHGCLARPQRRDARRESDCRLFARKAGLCRRGADGGGQRGSLRLGPGASVGVGAVPRPDCPPTRFPLYLGRALL